MGRPLLLAALLALLSAPPAGAQGRDREDPIPASVGPGITSGFYVNPSVPDGLDSARWLALAQRSLRRWGEPYLGTTRASPAAEDGRNVVGFAPLDGGTLGLTTQRDTAQETRVDRVERCTDTPAGVTDDAQFTVRSRKRVRLRRDAVRRGRVVRRTRRARLAVQSRRLRRTPVTARRCLTGNHLLDKLRLVSRERDITVQPSATWELGPAYPGDGEFDMEANLMHEIGHAHGLSHQPDRCDPGTPMRAAIGTASWWRGVDEAAWRDCAAPSATPSDQPGDPGPPGIGVSLAGTTVHANPSIPPGYDQARFLAVVKGVVERLGGTFGGPTTERGMAPDGVSVVAFGPVFSTGAASTVGYDLTERTTTPARGACTPARIRVAGRKVKRARVRRRVAGRVVRLRRDRIVRARRRIAGYRCTQVAAASATVPAGRELDVQVNDRHAYELGPGHPLTATRYDLETVVLRGLAEAAGARLGQDPCDASTPLVPLMPGDWWRGTADVSRAHCRRQDQAHAGQGAQPRRRAGGRRHVTVSVR